MDYFEFYEIPRSFQSDAGELRRIFLQKSKKYHPDFYTLEGEAKQAEVLELSTLNNEAYKTLSDSDKRMKYLLELEGVLSEEGQNSIPQDFLMDIMDINEAVMELEFDFDKTAYDKAIQQMESLDNNLYSQVAPLLDQYQGQADQKASLEQIKDYYLKKRYLLRIRENLNKFATL